MNNPSYLLQQAEVHWSGDTPESATYGDIYWHRGSALQEKQQVFIDPVKQQLDTHDPADIQFTIVELGFGFGVNCLLAAQYWQSLPASAQLNLVSIEKHPVRREELAKFLADQTFPHRAALIEQFPQPFRGQHVIWLADNIRLLLVLDDVETALSDLDAAADHWFLDGFAPSRNPDMWEDPLFRKIFARSRPGARVSTYSAAGQVRRGLEKSGFQVSRHPGYGTKKEMLSAQLPGTWQPRHYREESVTIIGAGIAGLFCAEALARRRQPCRIIDCGVPGASAIPQLAVFPHLAVQPEARYRFSLTASSYMRHAPGFHPGGMHWIPRNEAEAERLQSVAALFPNDIIEERADGSLFYHLAGWLATAELKQGCQLIIEPRRIERVFAAEDRWHCESQAGEHFSSDHLILATGSDRSLLAPMLQVRAIRGQAVLASAENLDHILNSHVTVFPPVNGQSLISGTYARGDDMAVSTTDTEHLLVEAAKLHTIDGSKAKALVGIRGVSRDRLPLVGPVPDWQALEGVNRISAVNQYQQGLHLCSAFGSRGGTHARLCAEHLVSQILGEPTALGREFQQMLSVARFQVRDRAKA